MSAIEDPLTLASAEKDKTRLLEFLKYEIDRQREWRDERGPGIFDLFESALAIDDDRSMLEKEAWQHGIYSATKAIAAQETIHKESKRGEKGKEKEKHRSKPDDAICSEEKGNYRHHGGNSATVMGVVKMKCSACGKRYFWSNSVGKGECIPSSDGKLKDHVPMGLDTKVSYKIPLWIVVLHFANGNSSPDLMVNKRAICFRFNVILDPDNDKIQGGKSKEPGSAAIYLSSTNNPSNYRNVNLYQSYITINKGN